MDDDLRTVRLRSLVDALSRLEAALAQTKIEWTRDAAIQRFEFLIRACLKSRLRMRTRRGPGGEVSARSPASRASAGVDWSDESLWLRMLDDRNRTSHTYNEAVAEEIFSRLAK